MLIPITLMTVMALHAAEPDARRFGVGVEGELAPANPVAAGPVRLAIPSLALTFAAKPLWGLQLLVGAGYASARTDGPIQSTTRRLAVATSMRAIVWPLRWDKARVGMVLQAGYRGGYGRQDAELRTGASRAHGLAVAAGVRPEWFVVPRLSLHTQFGVAYTFEHDSAQRTLQAVALAANVLGQAGATIWF